MAVAATASPAVPSLTPTSAASAGSTPAGRNSLSTTIAMPNERAATGVQVGSSDAGVAAGPRRAVVVVLVVMTQAWLAPGPRG